MTVFAAFLPEITMLGPMLLAAAKTGRRRALRAPTRLAVSLAVILSIVFTALAGVSVSPQRALAEGATAAQPFDPGDIYKRESGSVVTVVSVFLARGSRSISDPDNDQALGSGFVINGNGEIATNAHVVTNGDLSADNPRPLKRAKAVFVEFADGNQVKAKIVGVDPNADVALLRVNPSGLNLNPLPLGDSDKLSVGSPVVAIGSPFGEVQSLSTGVISGLNRTIESLTSFEISGAIQTDAAINHGNSGGPLVDAAGNVIGINAQIESAGAGIGFAIPINMVKRSLDLLRRTGRATYAYLGVSTVPVFPQLAYHFHLPVTQGAFVQEIEKGSPAAKAGIRAGKRTSSFQVNDYRLGGDIVVAVNGRQIDRNSDLPRLIGEYSPGEKVKLTVYRGGNRTDLSVTLSKRPNQTGDTAKTKNP